MEKKYIFLTGSSYEGSWETTTSALNGFGTYLYPDLSEYRGYFQNGKFHGYGRLRLAAPHKFTVEGNFVNGVLKDIAHMWFHDGLTVNATLDGNQNLNFKDWKYCRENDRRYVRELIYGLEPVSPNTVITSEKLTRELEKDAFDTEEGIYKETTGFISEGAPPFRFTRYVQCQEEKNWIIENCRRADIDIEEPKQELQDKILSTCMNVEKELQKRIEKKASKNDPCRHYFYKLCQKERETGAECVISDTDVHCPPVSETSLPSSFSGSSMKEEVKKICNKLQFDEVFGYHPDIQDVILRRSTFDNAHRQIVHFQSKMNASNIN